MNSKKWIKTILLSFLITGGSIYAASNGSVLPDDLAILPVNYQNKVYTNGDYSAINEDYEVYSKEGTVYLPLRLMSYVMSTNEASWEARWDASKPDEVTLVCNYMEKSQGGWTTTGEPQTFITLTVGSKMIKVDGVEKEIAAAPEKMDGRIVLPLRALGQALEKEVLYKDGLVFMASSLGTVQKTLDEQTIDQIKSHLEDQRPSYNYTDFPYYIKSQKGKVYYTADVYDEKKNESTVTLYERQKGGAAQALLSLKDYINVSDPIVGDYFYYIQKDSKDSGLYEMNLQTKEKREVCSLESLGMPDFVEKIIPHGKDLYIVAHYGDWTMGGETLYRVTQDGVQECASAKQFNSIDIEQDNIYYTTMDNFDSLENLYVYNMKNKEKTYLGQQGYTYDITRQIGSASISHSTARKMKVEEDKIYVLGYETASDKSSSALYEINLKTGTQKQITLPTQQYWFVGEQVYYVEKDTRYLITVDKDGNNKHTVLDKPVGKAELVGDNFYYCLANQDKEGQSGLYKYHLEKQTITPISTKKINDFYIGSSSVYYTVAGINPGIYKVQDGTTHLIENYNPYQYEFVENGIFYVDPYTKEIKLN